MSAEPVVAVVDSPAVTADDLFETDNAALDELFRRSAAGPIPDGPTRGTILAFTGTRLAKPIAALVRATGWQGKVFDRQHGLLRNSITPFRLLAVPAEVRHEASWVDQRECVLLDYSHTSFVAGFVRDEIRLVGPSVYLGVVWLRHRRVAWFALSPSRSDEPAAG